MDDIEERSILVSLDAVLRKEPIRAEIDSIAAQAERELMQHADECMAWQPIPLSAFDDPLPPEIQSTWVFILRSEATTGAERHPNSHQRVMSYRGSGDLQVIANGQWRSNMLVSNSQAPLLARWASIPANVWHQAVVPLQHWIVVSFHTAAAHELIEERPDERQASATHKRLYLGGAQLSDGCLIKVHGELVYKISLDALTNCSYNSDDSV
jgi:hypothetical protein